MNEDSNKNKLKFDLENRTTDFARIIIFFCSSLSRNIILTPLINQLIRSGTSIGANYREANGASSRKDFKNKIFICRKEARETKYWLELISSTEIKTQKKCKSLWNEAHELTLIFLKIIQSTN